MFGQNSVGGHLYISLGKVCVLSQNVSVKNRKASSSESLESQRHPHDVIPRIRHINAAGNIAPPQLRNSISALTSPTPRRASFGLILVSPYASASFSPWAASVPISPYWGRRI
jgi:hypothetical protein